MNVTKKVLLVAMTMAVSAAATAQNVRLAKVISVTPIETMQQSYELRPVCTRTSVPVYREVPVHTEAPVVQTHVQRDTAAPLLGMLLGAAIGGHVFRGDAKVAGTILGGAVGYGVGNDSASTVTTTTVQRGYSTSYRTELVGYQEKEICQTVYENTYRPVISGYRVTFVLDNVQRTVTMSSRPADYVKVVTSTTVVEP